MPEITTKNVWMKQEGDPRLPKKEADPLATAYDTWAGSKDGVTERGELLKALNPTIESAMTSYGGSNKEAVRIPAMMMAYEAVKRFNPKQDVKLNTYVFHHLQSLRRKAADRNNIVRIPEEALLDKSKLNRARDDLTDKIGREPTALELADETGLSPRRMERVMRTGNIAAESQMLNEKGDSLFSKAGDKQKIWSDYVYRDLDPVDKKIFEWSTGYGGAAPIKKGDMAVKLRISGAAVSKRIDRIIKKLEQGYNL